MSTSHNADAPVQETITPTKRFGAARIKENNMQPIAKAILLGACGLALAATSASAGIACNAEGECWHFKGRHHFKPEHGVRVYPDSWKWGEKEHFKWREHEGPGYWHGGVWIVL